jgi:hypothetical protein
MAFGSGGAHEKPQFPVKPVGPFFSGKTTRQGLSKIFQKSGESVGACSPREAQDPGGAGTPHSTQRFTWERGILRRILETGLKFQVKTLWRETHFWRVSDMVQTTAGSRQGERHEYPYPVGPDTPRGRVVLSRPCPRGNPAATGIFSCENRSPMRSSMWEGSPQSMN